MIDLTSKKEESINELIKKYWHLIELDNYAVHIPYLAIVYDTLINHIKQKYPNVDLNIKGWCGVLIRILYFNNKIESEIQITNIIDEFIDYWNLNYKNYCNNLISYTSEYDRDLGFVYKFIFEKS